MLVKSDRSDTDETVKAAAHSLLTELARVDDTSLSEFSVMFFDFFRKKKKTARTRPITGDDTQPRVRRSAVEEARFLAMLREHFMDDVAFKTDLADLESCKVIGRDGLNRIYIELFKTQRALAPKATRSKLVRDILDARVLAVRSKKAAELLLGPRVVPAE